MKNLYAHPAMSNALIAGASLALLAGCASGSLETASPSAFLPKLPTAAALPDLTPPPPTGGTATSSGSATETYARVAAGANQCWFGGSGPLKQGYISHAEADPPSRGGKAEITIHVREPALPNPRGAKAYKINIDPPTAAGGPATLISENVKMPNGVAVVMATDVDRWARGEPGCSGDKLAAAWEAAFPKPPEPAPAAVKTAAKKKPAIKPAKIAANKNAAVKPQPR